MYNRFYSYDNINMFDPQVWAGRMSPIRYLFHKIEEKNHELFRFRAGEGPYKDRRGEYNAKTLSYFYPEYINKWKAQGLTFHSTEMGGVCWTVMLPEDVCARRNRSPIVLVVLNDVDFSDPNWSIHVLTKYDHYTQLAAEQGFALLYINMDDVQTNDTPFGVMQEFSVIYNINMDRVYLDVSSLSQSGVKLSGIENFIYTGEDGQPVDDPDAAVFLFNNIPVLDISHRWQNLSSGVMDVNAAWLQHPKFDREQFIHSEQGRALADELRLEYDFDYGDDPEFLDYWDGRGLEVASHDFNKYQWISCVPKAYLGQNEEKLPVVLIFQEVTYQDRHQPVTALAAYKGYTELAASGELIALFFALERVKDNEMFMQIAEEAAEIYPIDMTRVYVTGQSHNGYFADVFAHQFHDRIAAVAPLGNHPGIPEPAWTTSPIPITDEMVAEWSAHDLPTILVTSFAESRNEHLHCRRDDELFSSAARAYQRRQQAQKCPVMSVGEILHVQNDLNPIRAEMGYPVDDVWVEYHDGAAAYIGELVNTEGKKHFRLAMLTNQTHFISTQMPAISWEFMRRFAKDPETGRTEELY